MDFGHLLVMKHTVSFFGKGRGVMQLPSGRWVRFWSWSNQ